LVIVVVFVVFRWGIIKEGYLNKRKEEDVSSPAIRRLLIVFSHAIQSPNRLFTCHPVVM